MKLTLDKGQTASLGISITMKLYKSLSVQNASESENTNFEGIPQIFLTFYKLGASNGGQCILINKSYPLVMTSWLKESIGFCLGILSLA